MRVVVLGAGYAGVTVARRLEASLPPEVELVVVDESGTHLVQHELHRLVRRPELTDVVTVPLEEVLERARVERAVVTDVDVDQEVASLETEDGDAVELDYDVGVVCLGAETAFHDLPGIEEHATPLKRVGHAETIRSDALAAEGGHAVVGGAGLSGVQVAGELAELSRSADLGLDVTLLEALDRVAPGFEQSFSAAIVEELEVRNVDVETGVAVASADAEAVHLADGRDLDHDVLVWTGGIRGPAALDGQRIPTGADLRVADGTFVVGDAASVVDDGGETAPASAQTAIRQGRVAARNVAALVASRSGDGGGTGASNRALDAYRVDPPGWVVSVGDGAVAQVGSVVVSGEPAKVAKALVGAGHLSEVGAIERAADLVAAEVGWPTADVASRVIEASERTPGGLSVEDLTRIIALGDRLLPAEVVDLTPLTGPTDRSRPDSPAAWLERTMGDSIDAVLGALSGRDPDAERPDEED